MNTNIAKRPSQIIVTARTPPKPGGYLAVGNISRPRWLSRTLVTGTFIMVVVAIIALFPHHIAPYDMAKIVPAERLQAPSSNHFFGTDIYGRDLFSRVLIGAQLSLAVAFLAVAIA